MPNLLTAGQSLPFTLILFLRCMPQYADTQLCYTLCGHSDVSILLASNLHSIRTRPSFNSHLELLLLFSISHLLFFPSLSCVFLSTLNSSCLFAVSPSFFALSYRLVSDALNIPTLSYPVLSPFISTPLIMSPLTLHSLILPPLFLVIRFPSFLSSFSLLPSSPFLSSPLLFSDCRRICGSPVEALRALRGGDSAQLHETDPERAVLPARQRHHPQVMCHPPLLLLSSLSSPISPSTPLRPISVLWLLSICLHSTFTVLCVLLQLL